MPSLNIYGNEIDSVFELIGHKEDHISRAVGWAMTKCPALLKLFLHRVFPGQLDIKRKDLDRITIFQQAYEKEKGFTDFEISLPGKCYLIVEAKKGWVIPTKEQLTKYSERASIQSDAPPVRKIAAIPNLIIKCPN